MYYYTPLLHTELSASQITGIAISTAALSAAVVALIAIFLRVATIKRRKLYKYQTASNLHKVEVHATDEDDQPPTRTVTVIRSRLAQKHKKGKDTDMTQ